MALFKAKTSTIPDLWLPLWCPLASPLAPSSSNSRTRSRTCDAAAATSAAAAAAFPHVKFSGCSCCREGAPEGEGKPSLGSRQKFCTMQRGGNLKANANNMEHFNAQWYEC